MQTVSQIIQDLSRFNPNARVEEDVEIQGISPATACRIETIGSEETSARLVELENENDKLTDRIEELAAALEQVKKLLEPIGQRSFDAIESAKNILNDAI